MAYTINKKYGTVYWHQKKPTSYFIFEWGSDQRSKLHLLDRKVQVIILGEKSWFN